MLTCVLSGPATSRSPTLAQLKRAGANLDEQPDQNPSHGLPDDPETGWITALVSDLSVVELVLASSDRWVLRLHWNTPKCRACEGHGVGAGGSTCLHCMGATVTNKPYRPPDPIEQMQTRLDELERRLAAGGDR